MIEQEKFTFFWHGPFSQWEPVKFSLHGFDFNCAEQYMMACKARYFDDRDAFNKIMATESPKEQKRLGRAVMGFDGVLWDMVAKQIVYTGNEAKFTQNNELLKQLLATKGTTLVEASPYDKIWGIGLSASDKRCLSRSTWLGTNWLGEVLTNLRNNLLKKKGF